MLLQLIHLLLLLLLDHLFQLFLDFRSLLSRIRLVFPLLLIFSLQVLLSPLLLSLNNYLFLLNLLSIVQTSLFLTTLGRVLPFFLLRLGLKTSLSLTELRRIRVRGERNTACNGVRPWVILRLSV